MIGEIIDTINRQELAQLFAQYKDKVSYNSEKSAMDNKIDTFTIETNNMIKFLSSAISSDPPKLSGQGAVYQVNSFGVICDVNGAFWVNCGLTAINLVDNLSGFPTVSQQDAAPWIKLSVNKLFSAYTPWTNLSLSNSWVSYGTSYAAPSYKKENKKVYLRGLVKSGLAATISTLPSEFRPLYDQIFSVLSNGVLCMVAIRTDGSIAIDGTYNNTWVSLDNICYHLD